MAELASWTARGRSLLAGHATGPALVLDAPLSFWGGLDLDTGAIVDRHHPQYGASVVGRVLVMPGGRGSSSSSSVLAEAIRVGRGPGAVLLSRADEIVVLGALVVKLLDGVACPVIELGPADYGRIATGDLANVNYDGSIVIRPVRALT